MNSDTPHATSGSRRARARARVRAARSYSRWLERERQRDHERLLKAVFVSLLLHFLLLVLRFDDPGSGPSGFGVPSPDVQAEPVGVTLSNGTAGERPSPVELSVYEAPSMATPGLAASSSAPHDLLAEKGGSAHAGPTMDRPAVAPHAASTGAVPVAGEGTRAGEVTARVRPGTATMPSSAAPVDGKTATQAQARDRAALIAVDEPFEDSFAVAASRKPQAGQVSSADVSESVPPRNPPAVTPSSRSSPHAPKVARETTPRLDPPLPAGELHGLQLPASAPSPDEPWAQEADRDAVRREATARRESTSAEAAQQERSRQEAVRNEALLAEGSRLAAAREDAERREAARQAATYEEQLRVEIARSEVLRQEAQRTAARQAADREAAANESAAQEESRREAARALAAREVAAREAVAREAAAREAAARELAARDAAARESAAREVAAREAAATEAAAREAAAKEAALREAAARNAADRERAASELTAREAAAKEAAAQEAAARDLAARDKAVRESAAREAAARESAATEAAARDAAAREVAAREAAARDAAARVAAARESAAREARTREAAAKEAAVREAAAREAAAREGAAREAAAKDAVTRESIARDTAAREAAGPGFAANPATGRSGTEPSTGQSRVGGQQGAGTVTTGAGGRAAPDLAGRAGSTDGAATQGGVAPGNAPNGSDRIGPATAATPSVGNEAPIAMVRPQPGVAVTAAARPASQTNASSSTARRRFLLGRNDRDVVLMMYAEGWRQRVEMNTSIDVLQKAARDQSHVDPVVTVSLRSDGSVEAVTVNRSSGIAEVDETVRRIVEKLAPFSEFPPDMAREYDVVDIKRVWTFDTALRLFSAGR